MLIILACCIGIYLGLTCGALVLLPLSGIGAGMFFWSLWAGSNFWAAFIEVLIPVISIQAAFMVGLVVRGCYGQLMDRRTSFNPGASS